MARLRARLIVSGDLHLGRHPARVPPDDPALSVEAVARSLADQAIERSVDAVVLAGDIADEANKHFEAFGILERLFHRLADAGIPVYVVAGDHDYDVLGSVVEAVDSPMVRLLGRGQEWERVTIERGADAVLSLVGWSYAGPHVHEPPVETFPSDGDVPTIGVLHADLGDDPSAYAPVTLGHLKETSPVAWVLGHGHDPRVVDVGGATAVVPGTPQPLDPREAGAHGAWLLNVASDGAVSASLLPIATVRYDAIDVDLDGADQASDVRERATDALRQHAAAVRDASPDVRRAVIRLTLRGTTRAYRHIERVSADLMETGETHAAGASGTGLRLAVVVDRVENRARPALNLDRLAMGTGPVASLASLARRLESGDLTGSDLGLVRQSVDVLHQARRSRVFEPLAQYGRLDDDLEAEAVARLRRQTYRLLDESLVQNPSDLAVPDADVSGDGAASSPPTLGGPTP
ncbi:MAG: DNA repair exonuclease [Bacteroidota bacterium]